MKRITLLIGTRKGAWMFHGDASRRAWRTEGPHFLGNIFNHVVLDPRDGRTILAAAKTGHLGPTIFRSTDRGKTWKEAAKPPAFPKISGGKTVDHTFWLTPGHASQPGVWFAGTSPQGLFRSADGGATWDLHFNLYEDPRYRNWVGGEQDGTPDGPKLHSILVDPRDPKRMLFGMSGGGVHESADGGRSFQPLIDGLAVVEGFDASQPTFHDPHCLRLAPSNPDRVYQQNHTGVYRLDRPAKTWVRIGKGIAKSAGDIGFPMVVHPRDADSAWIMPMDGSTVWPRVSPGGKPAVYRTKNAGDTWHRLASGFPEKQAWWTVKRQAMCADQGDPVGLYFGTTSGELWMSRDEGRKWSCIARHLPEIYSVECGS